MNSAVLSVGGFRQQFSVKENIILSKNSYSFFKNIKEILHDDSVDIQMFEEGYLTLFSSVKGFDILKESIKLQNSYDINTQLLASDEVANKFPWINTDGVKLASYGATEEGWFDPWSLLTSIRKRCKILGVQFIEGEITGFNVDSNIVSSVDVSHQNGKHLKVHGSDFLNCCGAWSGYVNNLMSNACESKDFPCLPVVPKKRNVFVIKVQEEAADKFDKIPLVFDTSGVWFRRDGKLKSNTFLVGKAPQSDIDNSFFWKPANDLAELTCCDTNYQTCLTNLTHDHEYFEEHIWEPLAHRVPAFEECKVIGGWAGFYDYNLLDQNAIIGKHLSLKNVFIATGFSGHGIQQSPSAGLALMELVTKGKYETFDFSRLGMERVAENSPLLETQCY